MSRDKGSVSSMPCFFATVSNVCTQRYKCVDITGKMHSMFETIVPQTDDRERGVVGCIIA
jgi:hypothetical protein